VSKKIITVRVFNVSEKVPKVFRD